MEVLTNQGAELSRSDVPLSDAEELLWAWFA